MPLHTLELFTQTQQMEARKPPPGWSWQQGCPAPSCGASRTPGTYEQLPSFPQGSEPASVCGPDPLCQGEAVVSGDVHVHHIQLGGEVVPDGEQSDHHGTVAPGVVPAGNGGSACDASLNFAWQLQMCLTAWPLGDVREPRTGEKAGHEGCGLPPG